LTGVNVTVVKDSVDITACRGYFISMEDSDSKFFKQLGGNVNVIVLARDLNYCWERLTYVKELMHLFDSQAEKTSSPELFVDLLGECHLAFC
jgi:hypothetical protein